MARADRSTRLIDNRDSPEEIARAFDVSRESLARLKLFAGLLGKWNARINLVAPSTIDQIWSRHIADSLQLLDFIEGDDVCVADVGSGGGFPGLVLAIALAGRPRAQVHLIESNAKKCAFLREAVRITGAPATVHNRRVEEFDSEAFRSSLSHVTARALAPLSALLEMTAPLMASGATGLFLKGQDVDSELTESAKCWSIELDRRPSRTEAGGSILIVKRAERVSRP